MNHIDKHITEQLAKQYKAHALMKVCETLHRAGLLRLLQVGFFRNTDEFDPEESFIVCIKCAHADDTLEHYEWTI